ncbi:MAG: AI-2E family transporter [Bacillota bacterium]
MSPAGRRALFYGGIAAATLLLLWHFRAALTPVLLGAFLAYVLAPPVRLLESRGLSPLWSIVTVYLLLGAVLLCGCIWVLPQAVSQLEKLVRGLPEYSAMVTAYVQRAQEGMYRVQLPQSMQDALLNAVTRAETAIEDVMEDFVNALFGLLSHSFSLLAAPVLAFYFLQDRHSLTRRFTGLIPPRWRGRTEELLSEMDGVMMGFIRSRILVAGFVGISVSLVFIVMDLPYSFLVGSIAGVADLIPYFGPILGAVPALLVAATHTPRVLLRVLVALVLIQQIESVIISPLIMGDGVSLHPVWVVIALFVGAQVGGIVGMLVAVPVFASLRVLGMFAWRSWKDPPGVI